MDDLLDLGEERRRSSATSVRSDAGGWGLVERVGQVLPTHQEARSRDRPWLSRPSANPGLTEGLRP